MTIIRNSQITDMKTVGSSVTYFRLMLWQEFAPSDEELEAYRKGEEWDPKVAEQRRRLKVRQSACFLLRSFSFHIAA